MEIRDLDSRQLDAAASLLAARHARDRRLHPEFPVGFEDAGRARQAIEACLERPQAKGIVALEGDEVLGYLIADLSLNGPRSSAWIRLPGHALAAGTDADVYRDLYAAAAADWVARGCFDHYILIPAADAAARTALFCLGFGGSQAYALRSLDAPIEPGGVNSSKSVDGSADWAIRRAGPGDAATLAGLSHLIAEASLRSPAFHPSLPEDFEALAEGFAELADATDWTVWLAERAGQALAYAAFFGVEPGPDDLLAPEACIELKIAATRPEARGRGLARDLVRHGLEEARRQGYRQVRVDWHLPNLLASRFWPRLGFEPVALRLMRRLDPRIARAGDRDRVGS